MWLLDTCYDYDMNYGTIVRDVIFDLDDEYVKHVICELIIFSDMWYWMSCVEKRMRMLYVESMPQKF